MSSRSRSRCTRAPRGRRAWRPCPRRPRPWRRTRRLWPGPSLRRSPGRLVEAFTLRAAEVACDRQSARDSTLTCEDQAHTPSDRTAATTRTATRSTMKCQWLAFADVPCAFPFKTMTDSLPSWCRPCMVYDRTPASAGMIPSRGTSLSLLQSSPLIPSSTTSGRMAGRFAKIIQNQQPE